MSFIISITHEYNRFQELESEWEDLQNCSRSNGAALTWTWINIWLEHFGDTGELWLMEARDVDNNKLIGLAPLFKRTIKPKYGFPYRQIEFIGSSHFHENLDFIINKNFEHRIIPKFMEVLLINQKDWDVLHFSSLINEDTFQTLLSTHSDWIKDNESEMVSPYATLPSETEKWLGTLSSNRRWKLRRYRKSLDDEFAGVWSLELISTHEELDRVFEYLVKYHQLHWEKVGKPGAFHYGQWKEYYRKLIHTFLDKGWLRMYCLYIERTPTAILFSYHYAGQAYNQISGLDQSISKTPLGHIVTQHSIETAIQEKLAEYHFMWGDEPYKYSFGAVNRTLLACELIVNRRVMFEKSLIIALRKAKRLLSKDDSE